MVRDEPYREAEKKIEEAQWSGTTKLISEKCELPHRWSRWGQLE
jgi:hypothetical protein